MFRYYKESAVSKQRISNFFIMLYLFGISFLIMMQSQMNPFHVTLPNVDSGVFHYIASVMKSGGLMYRDTFDHKGPLLYFINYLGLNLSYYSGAWFLELISMFLWTVSTYRTARLFCSQISSCFTVFLSSGAVLSCFFGGNYPESYALCCISGALFIFTDYYINQKISCIRLLLCGGFLGCVLMLKPNLIAVWIVFCFSILVLKIYKKDIRTLFVYLLWFVIGLAAVLIPIVYYLIRNGILMDWFNSYIIFNLLYSGDSENGSMLILLLRDFTRELVTPCILLIILAITKKKNSAYWYTYLVYFAVSLLLCCMSGNDYIYYRLLLVPCYAAPIAMFLSQFNDVKNQRCLKQCLLIFTAAIFVQFWIEPVHQCLSHFKHTSSQVDLGDEHHQKLFRLIEEYTTEEDSIVVYGNEDVFYFFSHRMAASRYSFQYPIILMDENIRHSFFTELEEKKPKLILVQSLWCNDEYIQDFLISHPYECITDMDEYELYRRIEGGDRE